MRMIAQSPLTEIRVVPLSPWLSVLLAPEHLEHIIQSGVSQSPGIPGPAAWTVGTHSKSKMSGLCETGISIRNSGSGAQWWVVNKPSCSFWYALQFESHWPKPFLPLRRTWSCSGFLGCCWWSWSEPESTRWNSCLPCSRDTLGQDLVPCISSEYRAVYILRVHPVF